jgi:hypothetical protein
MKTRWIRHLFLLAALYNLAIGCAVLLAYPRIFHRLGIALPVAHEGFLQFAAAMVAIFGVGFYFVAVEPVRNKDIIKLGVVFNLASAFVIGNHFAHTGTHWAYLFFGLINWAWAVFFAWVLWKLRGLAAGD